MNKNDPRKLDRTDIKRIIDLGFDMEKISKITMGIDIMIDTDIVISHIYIRVSSTELIFHKFTIYEKSKLIDIIKEINKLMVQYKR